MAKNLAAGLQKIENSTTYLFFGDFFTVFPRKYDSFMSSSRRFQKISSTREASDTF